MNIEDENKYLWGENIKKYDLSFPDEHVIRFLNKSYKEAGQSKVLHDK